MRIPTILFVRRFCTACSLAVVFFAGCATDAKRSASTGPPNVVLVVLDTLRADHLGCYGYERNTSPRIDAFASNNTRYTRALASAPWTVPTHASLFTGKPPFQHGAHTVRLDRPGMNANPLHEQQLTLAELLRDEGYTTAAFVANYGFLSPRWQLNQGFDTYRVDRVYADQLNSQIFDWFDSAPRQPFFLFVNYIDTHRPYNTTPRPGLLETPAVRDNGELLKELIQSVLPATDPVPADLARKVIDQYDTAVANVDEQVGKLLDRLSELGLDGNTVVVITSDHGEYFGEHQLVSHSKDVFQEVLGVPLLVRQPGQSESRVVDDVVVSNDVPHIIGSCFPEPVRSRVLARFPDAPGNHLVIAENYYTRSKDLFHPEWGWRFQRVRRAVFDWPFKYIDSSDGMHELYDLDLDPRESNNLIDRHPELSRRLSRALQDFEQSRGRPQTSPDLRPLDEEQRRRLQALGYIDG